MSMAGKTAMSAGDMFVSPITVWEISRKIALGKLERPAPPGFSGSLSEWLRQAGYRTLPLTWNACERASALPMHHSAGSEPDGDYRRRSVRAIWGRDDLVNPEPDPVGLQMVKRAG